MGSKSEAVVVPSVREVVAGVRRLVRAQWLVAGAGLVGVLGLATAGHVLGAVLVTAGSAGVLMVLARQVQATYRRVLDPCMNVCATGVEDLSVLVGLYLAVVDGPRAVKRSWLPPVTMNRMLARRASTPWWAPTGNVAHASLTLARESTAIIPVLIAELKAFRQTVELQAMADGRTVLLPVLMQDTAIAVMRLREALADDLMRQAYRDGVKQDQAAAAWLMLEL